MLNINSPFFCFITTVGNLIIVNFLWGISCIPLITAGASTATLYYTCVKVIRHDRGSIFSSFFQSFRSNLKQGCVITVPSLFISYILYMNFHYSTSLKAGSSEGSWYLEA